MRSSSSLVLVVTVNIFVVVPAATTTFAGTVARLLLELVNATVAPPAGAAVVSVTVPLALLPPVTLDRPRVSAASAGTGAAGAGLTVNVVVVVRPPEVADKVPMVVLATAAVAMPKVALLAPPRTVTS